MIYAIHKRTKEHRVVGQKWPDGLQPAQWGYVEADSEGWIECPDGLDECPVPRHARIEYRMASGEEVETTAPQYKRWDHNIGISSDIIAYRPILDTGESEPPAWDGEGLPPVGCECEYLYSEGATWRNGVCVGHHNAKAVIVDLEDEGAECCPPFRLRHIRSEEDIAVEEMERAYRTDPSSPSVTHGMRHLYRAIRDSKIPGVTLEVDP